MQTIETKMRLAVQAEEAIRTRQARAARRGRRLSPADAWAEVQALEAGGPHGIAQRARDLQDDASDLGLTLGTSEAVRRATEEYARR